MKSFPKIVFFLFALIGLTSNNVVDAACSDATDCAGCLAEEATSQAGCTWFPDTGFCQDGCGMDGCGASVCAEDITTCAECFAETTVLFSYAWSPSDSRCYESCMEAPADAACFPGSDYTPEEVCQPMTCGDATNCGDCLTAQATSEAGCNWFPDTGFCQDGCGMDGCGAFTCASDITTCSACLAETTVLFSYAWSPDDNSCYESCMDAPADAACFPGSDYGVEVCPCNERSCEDCMEGDSCVWSPDAQGPKCLNDCMEGPADASCFPGANYGPEICSDSRQAPPPPPPPADDEMDTSDASATSGTNGTDPTSNAPSQGRLSGFTLGIFFLTVIAGQAFSGH